MSESIDRMTIFDVEGRMTVYVRESDGNEIRFALATPIAIAVAKSILSTSQGGKIWN